MRTKKWDEIEQLCKIYPTDEILRIILFRKYRTHKKAIPILRAFYN